MNILRSTFFLILSIISVVRAQSPVVKTEKLVNASINGRGELEIIPSEKSSVHDFDFLQGKWKLHNKRLKTRLNHCTEWIEFEAVVDNQVLLNGLANLDVSKSFYAGRPSESLSLRIFNPQTRLWSSYWVDGKNGMMDPPVIGSFEENIGIFYGKTIYNDIPVLVMYKWDKTDPGKPEWSQAYSTDNGKTWEWNSRNVSSKNEKELDPEPMLKVISTDSSEFNAAFSPDGNSFYFSRAINKQTRIFVTKKTGNTWSTPEPVPFSNTKFSDADPAFSPTGELYFISNRPLDTDDSTNDYDIWKVMPVSANQWSAPVNVKALNSKKDEFYISFTKKGDVYFSSSRDGGYGEEDIYYCENKNNTYGVPQNLGSNVNSVYSEYDPFITADASGLIFTSSGRKDSFGKGDLYWSIKSKANWAEAKHFDLSINTATRDYCPYITADSKYFFYSSKGDVKFMSTENLPDELKHMLKR